MDKYLAKITTSPMRQVVIFFLFFLFYSSTLGPRIISGHILYRGGFAIYGGLGKAAIFGLIALALLIWHKRAKINFQSWQPKLLIWLAASVAAYLLAWQSVNNLLGGHFTISNLILAHSGLILSVALAALGSFGETNLLAFWQTFRRQIWQAIIIATLFYLFLTVVYALWQPLAGIVLLAVRWLLNFTSIPTQFFPPNTLLTDKFGVTVAQYCSGIESIALFTGLYVVVGLMERQRLRLKRYLWLFLPALVLLMLLNILRVFGLIAAGYYINPHLAFSLFHTYAGMIFFIIYSAIFWAVAYKHIMTSREGEDNR